MINSCIEGNANIMLVTCRKKEMPQSLIMWYCCFKTC